MSANPQTSADPAAAAAEQEHEEHGHHPTPRDYVRIALILGVLTAMEFSTYVVDFGGLGIPLLVVLIAIKFVLVASWFMHLKFDNKLFSRLMYGGMVLALSLYVITLVVMLFASATAID
jgi:cytochrome c oxidase subunit IV